MKLIIISGLSGSGKSIALNTLEDLDYYCIDNMPIGMLPALVEQLQDDWGKSHTLVAVGIDARNSHQDLKEFPELARDLSQSDLSVDIFYLKADDNTLLKRFSETRRKHPLTTDDISLSDAILIEKELLLPIASQADLLIDTTHTNIYQLRELVRNRVVDKRSESMSILFQSFGFKHGPPSDADFIFDTRCLPNPHWEASLRPLTGKDKKVIQYLDSQAWVGEMKQQIIEFLDIWIPRFEQENRSYMTIAIGCTGGQHRSVYMAEALNSYFSQERDNTMVRHREIS
ncbi:MAG: RNase adapter RapZ [Gammaproteobacteria bacterium]|nr:RNase adapter RapZ [Gammaproteobacteria bacterium]